MKNIILVFIYLTLSYAASLGLNSQALDPMKMPSENDSLESLQA